MTAVALVVSVVGLAIASLFAASAVWWSLRARDFNAATREFQTGSFEAAEALLVEAKRRRQDPPWFVRLTGGTDR